MCTTSAMDRGPGRLNTPSALLYCTGSPRRRRSSRVVAVVGALEALGASARFWVAWMPAQGKG